MIALLKKDIFVMDKQMRLMVILALFFLLLPNGGSYGSSYTALISVMLPMSTISYDERCKWDRYAAVLPWTPQQIVGSKYILSYVATVASILMVLAAYLIRPLYSDEVVIWEDVWSMLGIYLGVLVVMTAVIYPLMYRFGTERGRLILVAIFVGIFIVFFGAAVLLVENVKHLALWLGEIPAPVLAVAAALVVAVGSFLSYRLSVRFYLRRREGAYT